MGVVNYDISQVGKFLFDTIIMWCATNKTKPTHRWPTLSSSLYFWWWNFFTKGCITWFQMWSVFSLCGLLYIRAWPFQTCPFTWYICFLRVRPSGVWTFLQWVWNLQECSPLLQRSFLPWLLRKKAGELGREMQKIAIEHRKHILCIQTPPLHKPQKNEKTELKITHTYSIKINVIMWMCIHIFIQLFAVCLD